MNERDAQTICDLLQYRAEFSTDSSVLNFLPDGEHIEDQITFFSLWHKAVAIANLLSDFVNPGDRVLLPFLGGADFSFAFFGCLLARTIAVPVAPPRKARLDETLKLISSIAANCDAKVILTTRSISEMLRQSESSATLVNRFLWISIEDAEARSKNLKIDRMADPEDVAFLQYTSGSTGNPKGVVVSHGNLYDNSEKIRQAFGLNHTSKTALWLPFFHDMGLVGGIIQPIYSGYRAFLMPPQAFLQKPSRWLKLISDIGAEVAGGPNFAFELCVNRINEVDAADLDLSHWRVAFNGAEPVRKKTIKSFSQKFGPYGFQSDAFVPCYGLAESTLIASSHHWGIPIPSAYTKDVPEEDSVLSSEEFVSCGAPVSNTEIRICGPDSLEPLGDERTGEIILSSDSVADRYWNSPVETESTFVRAPNETKLHLRTGDLGFLKDGQLYVVGRKKDILKLRGRSIAPQDIEASVETLQPDIAPSGVAAVATDDGSSETLSIVAEVSRNIVRNASKTRLEKLVGSIRSTVALDHGLAVERVILLRPMRLPRTTSGKVRRQPLRRQLKTSPTPLSGSLFDWTGSGDGHGEYFVAPGTHQNIDTLLEDLRRFARQRLNSRLVDERRSISPGIVFDLARLGLFGLEVSKSQGGLGLSTNNSLRVIEQLGAIDLNLALFVGLHNALGLEPLLEHGSSTQISKYVSDMAQGRELIAFSLTEEHAGSNPRAIKAKAVRDEHGNWRLSGKKVWSGSSAWARCIIVFAQGETVGGEPLGSCAFLLETDVDGVEIGPEAPTMGMRGMVQNSMSFKNVALRDANLLGNIGSGFLVAEGAMMKARVGIASMCIGAMKRAIQLSARYASQRTVGAGPLLEISESARRLTKHIGRLKLLETFIEQITSREKCGKDVKDVLYLTAKIVAPEFLWDCVDDAVQLSGGRGYIETNELPRILRDSRVLRIFEGPTETLTHHLGGLVSVNEQLGTSVLRDFFQAEHMSHAFRLSMARLNVALSNEQWSKVGSATVRQRLFFDAGRLFSAAVLHAAAEHSADSTGQILDAAAEYFQSVQLSIDFQNQTNPPKIETLKEEVLKINGSLGNIDQLSEGIEMAPDRSFSFVQDSIQVADQHLPNRGSSDPPPGDKEEIARWLDEWLTKKIGTSIQLDVALPLAALGVDSILVAELTMDIEDTFGVDIDSFEIWDLPTIDQLIELISGRHKRAPVDEKPIECLSEILDMASKLS